MRNTIEQEGAQSRRDIELARLLELKNKVCQDAITHPGPDTTPQAEFESVIRDLEDYLKERKGDNIADGESHATMKSQYGDLSDEDIEYIISRLRAD